MKISVGDVYILFGDSARSDGSNIYGIFTTLEAAQNEKEYMEGIRPEEFHIEEHGLWGNFI